MAPSCGHLARAPEAYKCWVGLSVDNCEAARKACALRAASGAWPTKDIALQSFVKKLGKLFGKLA